MKEELKKLANIPLDTLIAIGLKDGKTKEEVKEEFRKLNQENVHEIFGYRKFNDDFADYISIYNNGSVLGYFTPCYDEFLRKLASTLNVPKREKYVDDEQLDRELKEQLDKFKASDRPEVYNEFPGIYRDYKEGKIYLSQLKEEYEGKPKDDEYHEKEKYFYRCALSPRFEKAMERQLDFYTRLVERREEYKKLIESKRYGAFIVDNFDVYKVAMFVMYGYLEFCKGDGETYQTLRMYERIVGKYINAPKVKDTVVELPNGGFIDYNTIIMGYEMLKEKINSMDIKSPFRYIPKGEKLPVEHPGVGSSGFPPEATELQKRGLEKVNFYENTDYIGRGIGTEQFNGYIAYFYPNGKVILDRKYEERYPSTAYGSAAYHFKTRFFEMLSNMDKTKLKKIPMVGHINHNETWQERMLKVINEEGTEEDIRMGEIIIEKLRAESEKKQNKK